MGAADAYFTLACDQIHAGNDRLAEVLMTRGIYLCTGVRRPALRTLAATAQVFGARGEADMAREQEDRVRTLTRIARRLARTSPEKARLEDEEREMTIATHGAANTWRAPGTRALFQQAVIAQGGRSGAGTAEGADALTLLSNARLLLAEGQVQPLPALLSELLTAAADAPDNQRCAVFLATYCLARACHDEAAMRDCAQALARQGLQVESIFSQGSPLPPRPEVGGDSGAGQATGPSQKFGQVVAILAAADPRCIAVVALSLRMSGQTQLLLEMLWRAANMGLPIGTLDPLLCELVRLPNLSITGLRQISDELLFTAHRLTIPSGLGWYYYPGIMLVSAWLGGVLVVAGFSAAKNWGAFLPVAGTLLAAGAVGAFADLWLWQRTRLWERPEKSRHVAAELGTIAAWWAAIWLTKSHIPESVRHSGAAVVGVCAALGAEGLLMLVLGVRGLIFGPWRARGVAWGSAVACLAGAGCWWMAPRWAGGATAQNLLGGLFLSGIFAVSAALNILPKHIACVRHFGQRGDFNREDVDSFGT